MNPLLPLVPLIAILPFAGFWVWMYRDMADNPHLSADAKRYWTLVFALMNVFGAAWYYAAEYRNRG